MYEGANSSGGRVKIPGEQKKMQKYPDLSSSVGEFPKCFHGVSAKISSVTVPQLSVV